METATVAPHDLGEVGKDSEHTHPSKGQRDFSGQTLTEEFVKVGGQSLFMSPY